MCSSYRPTTGRVLVHFGVEPPDDIVARDAYPVDVGFMMLREVDAPVSLCVAEKPLFRNRWRHQQRSNVPADTMPNRPAPRLRPSP